MGKLYNVKDTIEKPEMPELFTDPEIADYGEVLSTTESGCIFILKDDDVIMFTPVAKIHNTKDCYYYQKVEFR